MVDGPPVGFPALSAEQDVQTTVAVAHPRGSQVSEPDTERRLIFGLALVVVFRIVIGRTVLPHKAAGTADADLKIFNPKAGD